MFLCALFLCSYVIGNNSFPKPLSQAEELQMLNRYAEGDVEAKNILVERNLRLVAHIVKKYNNHSKELEDLISIGTIGLIKAITTYKPGKGTKLATYAARCIDNAMPRYVARAAAVIPPGGRRGPRLSEIYAPCRPLPPRIL